MYLLNKMNEFQCPQHGNNNDCSNFRFYGYNCVGKDTENRNAPWGFETRKAFYEICQRGINGYGPCKCSETDTDCHCGRITVDGKIYVADWTPENGWIDWRLEILTIKSALKR